MAAYEWTLKRCQSTYNRLRRLYFLRDLENPDVGVPPTAGKLCWSWIPGTSRAAGVTHFDEDGDPESIELNEDLRHWPNLMRIVLLHELTHMRLGSLVACPSDMKRKVVPPKWKVEQTRLAALGAPLL